METKAQEVRKDERVIYGSEHNADSIRTTASFTRVILILSALASGVSLALSGLETGYETIAIIGGILILLIGIAFACAVGGAIDSLAQVVEKTAKLEAAVSYLDKAHHVEVRGFEEIPAQDIPAAADDSFESMRIDESGVTFCKVTGDTVECPFCGRKQPVGTKACENCGQVFYYDS